MRQLAVWIDARRVGTLQEQSDLWAFDYHPQWQADAAGFDLAPGLPRQAGRIRDGASHRPVQWYFDNLLPEELLRQSIAREAGLRDTDDAFGLLAFLGAESAGSLTLAPPYTAAAASSSALRRLDDGSLSRRIQGLPRSTLMQGAPRRMSLAGAQHKLPIVALDGDLYEPVGATPSTHILKPDHPQPEAWPSSAFLEWLTMRLADAAGLVVPRVALHHAPEPVFVIERFDRTVDGDRLRRLAIEPGDATAVARLHVIDACQLLDKARGFKHSGASLAALASIVERCSNRIDTRLRLYRWLVFNVALANDDCHLKNLSFHVDAQGIRLAPHYDLLATGAYHTRALADQASRWPQVPMTIELPGASTFGDATRQRLLAAGEALGVPGNAAARIVDAVLAGIEAGLQRLGEVLAAPAMSPAEQAQRGAYAHLLRVVRHVVFHDMQARLSR